MVFLIETITLGLSNLRLRILRTVLTALGIILGVGAVITMVSLGEGSKRAALVQIEKLGARNVIIRSQKPPEDQRQQQGQRSSWSLRYGLTRADFEVIAQNFPEAQVVPLKEVGAQVWRGRLRRSSQAFGTTPELLNAATLRIGHGRYLKVADLEQASLVCVLGADIAKQLFPLEDPLGQTINIDNVALVVVGTLEPVGLAGGAGAALVGRDLDQDVHIPITTARQVFGDLIFKRTSGSFQSSEVQISEIYLVSPGIERVMTDAAVATRLINSRRSKAQDVTVKVPYELLENAERTALTYKLVFGAVAGIGLLVGGIGIMNIMLATVTERTREIGIRRALGATRGQILLQFLVETSVISTSGGLIGIALGVGLSVFLDWGVRRLHTLPWIGSLFPEQYELPTAITPGSILVAFSFAVFIGLIFGIYPARRAAAQDPIVALRHS